MEEEKLVAFIVKNNRPFGGEYFGYVAVSPKNRYYRVHYDKMLGFDVHGGELSYSAPVVIDADWYNEYMSFICDSSNIGKRPILEGNGKFIEYLTEYKTIEDDWFIFGFDTCHYLDNKENCNREYVVKETLKLMEQLKNKSNE